MGVLNLGFNVIYATDKLEFARDVYVANMPGTEFVLSDISEIAKFPKADLLIGCYPCQGFSQAGARDADRNVNYLYREFGRALRQIRPKAFVVENVPGMRREDLIHLLSAQLTQFRFAGYAVTWFRVNAADFGVPQHRDRLFIVGIRSDIKAKYQPPKPTHGPNGTREFRTQRDAIGHLPIWPVGEFHDEEFHWYYLSRNRRTPWDSPSKTVVGHARHVPLHPSSPPLIRVGRDEWRFVGDSKNARRISYREAMLLQGFPRRFKIPDKFSLRMKYTVIGNAVPPKLFTAVVGALPDIW
jgi:DNA (cytosine-5)-methyltransferase 1